jgi:MFS family permease
MNKPATAIIQNSHLKIDTRPRVSVSVLFFVLGIDFASWASRIPAIKANLRIDDGTLGTLLLASPIGSLLTLPLAGWLVTRFGSRRMVLLSAVFYSLVLPMLGFAAEIWQLAVALFLFGIGGEVLNISVNTQAVEVEKLFAKPIMSSFHGFFSLGGMAGAAIGGLMVQWHISPAHHLLGMMAVGMLTTLFFFNHLLPKDEGMDESHPLFARPSGVLISLGVIAFCCMLGEGAMSDWSSEYFKQIFKTESALTTAGYTAFSLAMAIGRFNGDRLTAKWGEVKILKISGWVAASGLAVALLITHPVVTILGFACVGLGYATVVPLVYSAAGRSKVMAPGVALAAVSTLGYLGFLFGPPLIGWGAEWFNLRISLGLVVLLSLMIVVLARKSG